MNIGQGIKKKVLATRERLAAGKHKSFHLTPRERKRPHQHLELKTGVSEAWRLTLETLKLIWSHKKIFLWLAAFYSVSSYLLVGGIAQSDYVSLKEESVEYTDGFDVVTNALAYFGAAVTGGLSAVPTELQQFLTGFVTLIFWLVTIWAARLVLANKNIKLRDAFYSGTTPLVSTLVVLMIVVLQLIPAAVGLFGMSTGITEGWITNFAVAIAYGAAALLLSLLSLYWLSGSVIAVAIVALPGMYPIQAMRDARTLATGKRWNIMLRIITALILMLLVWVFLLVPVFMLDHWLRFDWLPLVPIAIQIVSGFSLVFASIYVYKLYRSLL